MKLIELILIAVGLSMDAFAVAVCKGLSTQNLKLKHSLITGLFFGGFQAVMPLAGFLLGTQFKDYIVAIDHWIAFILLFVIGVNMIRESRDVQCTNSGDAFGIGTMTVLSIATSIDALVVGVTFAFLRADIFLAISIIGVVTFVLSAVGVKFGNFFGTALKSKAEFAGGIILIAMGVKILIEHLKI